MKHSTSIPDSAPRAAAPKPGTAEFAAQRQRLAQLIGRLMARRWLRQHRFNCDPEPSEDETSEARQ